MIVRPATVRDAEAVATIHVRSWQATYPGLVPQEYLARLDPAERIDAWRQTLADDEPPAGTTVLEDDGVPVGFVRVGPGRSRDDTDTAEVGEITVIYILGTHWGRGGGRQLMAAAVGRLAAAGFREAVLWVLDGNERARAFYERLGWYADGATTVEDLRGIALPEVRYRRDLSTKDEGTTIG